MVDVGSAVGYLLLDTSSFEKGLSGALSDLKTFSDDTTSVSDKLSALGSSFTSAGKTLTAGVTLPIVGVGTAAVKMGNDFEAQMSRVKAIAGATSDEFEALSAQALQLGSDTSFSASQVAEGMENLASAGFTAEEIMAAMPGLLDLAASSGADLATASEIAASAVRGFGLEAEDAAHVADVFAEAAARTNAQTEDMGEAMKYVAPVANAMGQSLEETAAAIGIMSDAGIKGSQAGTTLRGALSRLARPTDDMEAKMEALNLQFYDAEGNMVPLNDMVQQLQDSFEGLTQEEQNNALITLFGQESLSGMLALIQRGPEELRAMTESFEEANGAASEMATVMLDNTAGAIEEFTGSVETLAIKIQQAMAPAIQDVVKGLTDFVNALSSMDEETLALIVTIAGVAAALGPVLIIVGQIINAISLISANIAFLTNPITIAVAAIVALFTAYQTNLFGIRDLLDGFASWIQSIADQFNALVVAAIEKVIEVVGSMASAVANAVTSAASWITSLPDRINEAFNKALEAAEQWATDFMDAINSAIQGAVDAAVSVVESVITAAEEVGNAIRDTIDSIVEWFSDLSSNLGYVLGYAIGTVMNWAEELHNFVTVRIPEIIETIVSYFATLPERLAVWFTETINQSIEFWDNMLVTAQDTLSAIISAVEEWAVSLYESMVEWVESTYESVVEWFESIFVAITEWLTSVQETITEWLTGVATSIVDGVTSIYNTLVTWLSSLPGLFTAWMNRVIEYLASLPSRFMELGSSIMQGFFDGIKSIGESILDWFRGLVDSIQDFLSSIWEGISDARDAAREARSIDTGGRNSHAAGLDYVPYDGYRATLHEGEAVLTKAENQNRTKQATGNTFIFNSPEAIDEVKAAQQFKRVQKELAKGL